MKCCIIVGRLAERPHQSGLRRSPDPLLIQRLSRPSPAPGCSGIGGGQRAHERESLATGTRSHVATAGERPLFDAVERFTNELGLRYAAVKIKLDENLPARLVSTLAALGQEVDTVAAEGLAGFDDSRIWAAAQAHGRFLITHDLDFADVRRFVPGSHHGVLILRGRAAGAAALFEHITRIFTTEATERWAGKTVIASDRKVRVHG